MNRIIKFRIWDTLNKKFYFNGFHISADGKPFIVSVSWFKERLDSGWKIYENEGELIVQQFTGLKDKNGKEIYEGDLLKISEKDRPNYFKDYCHVWYSDSGCFVVSFNHLYSETSCELFMVNYTYEIIGNIFENPELLK